MTTTDIAKIRQLLAKARSVYSGYGESGRFIKLTTYLDEALALLPCKTCGGHRWTKGEPCPDCQS